MVINSFRHNNNLIFNGHIVVAPRCFEVDKNNIFYNLFYIHIDNDYAYVWRSIENTCLYIPNYRNVLYYGRYKLYLNKKGLYFDLHLYYNHKSIRIYLCD